uniref:Link domain-containing protein n=1 Tax=Branchiostoma floridae TaxID=7739 RepID=C3XT87_BRAFL|eukprot:XP_002612811.1 hypothetical protein BRAFLDRAFT_82167 [Branchiostoma floridae]
MDRVLKNPYMTVWRLVFVQQRKITMGKWTYSKVFLLLYFAVMWPNPNVYGLTKQDAARLKRRMSEVKAKIDRLTSRVVHTREQTLSQRLPAFTQPHGLQSPALQPTDKDDAGHKPTSCVEAKSLSSDTNDGEYILYPFATDSDVSIRIYCHGMASGEPKEFLTLPSGPDENYAVIFAGRMRYAYQCTGSLQDPWANRGTTKFSKLRIQFDTSRVKVIRNVYTFAQTTGPNDVPYGKAADCYSAKQGCAKGTFKVNLTGTDLALAPEVHWVMGPHYPASLIINDMFISEDRKVASARCGGWCGHCRPNGGEIYLTPSQVWIFPMQSPAGTYKYTLDEARQACAEKGATLASYNQLNDAWKDGLDYCACGWLSDGTARYPTQRAREGCGEAKINLCDWRSTWDAWSFTTLGM